MIIPAGYRVLVEQDPLEKTTEAGIVIVSDEKLEKANINKGTLVAIGSTAWEAFGPNNTGRPWATVGDRVIFARYAGKAVDDPEEPYKEYRIMNDEDIVAVITGEI